MNTPQSLRLALLVLAIVLNLPAIDLLAQGGSLTPPGPPAPLFKTLDEVEPRIAITSLPTTITQGGSYYLTKSFAQDFAFDAISIRADNVSLDLCGFTIQQTAGANFVSGVGVSSTVVNTPVKQFAVRNGLITGFTNGLGVDARGVQNSVVENLVVASCGDGVRFQAFGTAGVSGNVVRHCRTLNNGVGTGVLFLSGAGNLRNAIEHCESLNNGTGFSLAGGGNLIIGCRASGNGNNYVIAIGNRGGAIILPTASIAAFSGSTGALGSGTTDPFANLSF